FCESITQVAGLPDDSFHGIVGKTDGRLRMMRGVSEVDFCRVRINARSLRSSSGSGVLDGSGSYGSASARNNQGSHELAAIQCHSFPRHSFPRETHFLTKAAAPERNFGGVPRSRRPTCDKAS